MNGLPGESEELIHWGIKKYKEFLSDNLETRLLEQDLFTDISSKVKFRGYFTKSELGKILAWRRPTIPRYLEKNSEHRINTITKEAFQAENDEIRIHILTLLHGLGLSSASRLLMIFDPANYSTFNVVNWKILSKWNYVDIPFQSNPKTWVSFVKIIQKIIAKYELSGREIDQSFLALYLKYGLNKFSHSYIPLDKFFTS